jgi:DNA (cytosine-5)-methyltransferase 1
MTIFAMANKPVFIDLFCGCGGFSLGLERAGFKGLAAIDFNKEALQIFRANFEQIPHALEKDLTEFTPSQLEELIGVSEVDLIVGGPPCQGFSTARQVDGANHGDRLKDDPRRVLYKQFLKYVDHFKPKVFVMENVLGIRSASGGIYFSKVQAEARALGYRVHAQLEECVKLGVPQKRRRQLFIGTRNDLPAYFRPQLKLPDRAMAETNLWDAIGDLPTLGAGEGDELATYDIIRRIKHSSSPKADNYIQNVLEIDKVDQLSAHRSRPHNDRDLRDFARLKEGESSAEAMRRGIEFEFPYDKSTFKDRFTRQHRNLPCSTIVAHLAKDGLMFIHPTQNRSLTPREAARIQSFPDWFEMPTSRTHQFKALGNAVPPLVSEAIGEAVKTYLSDLKTASLPHQKASISLPTSDIEASETILSYAKMSLSQLKSCPSQEIKSAWHSVGFLYLGLHPDSALEHGNLILDDVDTSKGIAKLNSELVTPYYEQSGWPVILTNLALDAWRRYKSGEFSDDEFYCCDAQRAGYLYRNPDLELSA